VEVEAFAEPGSRRPPTARGWHSRAKHDARRAGSLLGGDWPAGRTNRQQVTDLLVVLLTHHTSR